MFNRLVGCLRSLPLLRCTVDADVLTQSTRHDICESKSFLIVAVVRDRTCCIHRGEQTRRLALPRNYVPVERSVCLVHFYSPDNRVDVATCLTIQAESLFAYSDCVLAVISNFDVSPGSCRLTIEDSRLLSSHFLPTNASERVKFRQGNAEKRREQPGRMTEWFS